MPTIANEPSEHRAARVHSLHWRKRYPAPLGFIVPIKAAEPATFEQIVRFVFALLTLIAAVSFTAWLHGVS